MSKQKTFSVLVLTAFYAGLLWASVDGSLASMRFAQDAQADAELAKSMRVLESPKDGVSVTVEDGSGHRYACRSFESSSAAVDFLEKRRAATQRRVTNHWGDFAIRAGVGVALLITYIPLLRRCKCGSSTSAAPLIVPALLRMH